MGWSYRKSFGSGPFRVNFSKSGISYSVGVKGARVNMGPRGTYVNLSSHGISYRRKISGTTVPSPNAIPQTLPAAYEQVHNIASANITQLTDTDSKDFIAELTQKASQIAYVNWFGVFPLVTFLVVMLFTAIGSQTVITQPAVDSTQVKVTTDGGANIRKAANAWSSVLKTAAGGQTFVLIDSANSKWLKIGFNDSSGYISRRFAAIEHIHHDQVAEGQAILANPYAVYEVIIGLIGFTVLIRWLKRLDKKRFEMELHYDMDEQFQQVYTQFGNLFTTFSFSARIWQYLNARQTNDYKRTGGAAKLIKRIAVRSVSANRGPIRYLITNVAIPCLKLSNIEFYFLPERMIVKQGGAFAAVFYKHLRITSQITRFIEDEVVPRDAQVVDRT